jgi:GAF domain-containing protein
MMNQSYKWSAQLGALLDEYGLPDTRPEEMFDLLAGLAAIAARTPVAIVGFIDADDRLWLKSKVGLTWTEVALRSAPLLEQTLLGEELLIVEDARGDERFLNDDLVRDEPHARSYAGLPLHAPGGYALGVLAVIARVKRTLTTTEQEALTTLGRVVISQLERRRSAALLITPAQSANAQVAVCDGANHATQLERMAQEAARWMETVNHYLEEIKKYETMIDKQVEQITSLGNILRTVDEELARHKSLI